MLLWWWYISLCVCANGAATTTAAAARSLSQPPQPRSRILNPFLQTQDAQVHGVDIGGSRSQAEEARRQIQDVQRRGQSQGYRSKLLSLDQKQVHGGSLWLGLIHYQSPFFIPPGNSHCMMILHSPLRAVAGACDDALFFILFFPFSKCDYNC